LLLLLLHPCRMIWSVFVAVLLLRSCCWLPPLLLLR
jgi:hypothetical protein